MDAIFLKSNDYLFNNSLTELRSDIKVLKFRVVTPWAPDGAPGHKYRCPDTRSVS